jgi:transcriptional regulator with XRE-family HTH domain
LYFYALILHIVITFTLMKSKEKLPKLNRVAEVLKQKKVTQRELAQKLGISANAMNSICKQRAQPLGRLFQISQILGVSITAIINMDYKPNKH